MNTIHMPDAQHNLHYTSPATKWSEALPLGNGMLGALVWGDGRPLTLSLDRADLWDLRPAPEFHSPEYTYARMVEWHRAGRHDDLIRLYEAPYNRPAPTRIPAGRIHLTFPAGAGFASAALSLRDAVAGVQLSNGATVRVFMHATDPVGLIRVEGVVPEVSLVAPAFGGAVGEAAAGGRTGDLAQLGYPAPEQTAGPTWRAFIQQGAEGFRFAVYVAWRDAGGAWEAAWSIASSFEGDDPPAIARARVNAALEAGFDVKFSSHAAWWRAYWAQSAVQLPNPIIERQWYLEQYKFGAASRRGAPPITLQGPWTADDGSLPPWKGDYHHDLNTQLSYWPCYSGNRLEEGLSYLDWLWETRPACFDWTRRFFGLPGLNVPMTADLNNNQIGGWRQYTHSPTTAAWLAQHFYLHWKYSADPDFLRQRAYPYLRDASVFIEAISAQRDAQGYRTLPLSASPEINDNRPSAWFDTLTNYDLALMRWLLGATAELAAEVGLAGEAAHWRGVLGELPDFARGEDGRLLVTRDYPLPESHRHLSHLMAIHPLGLIDWEDGAAAQQTIRASLDELERVGTSLWCGYSFAWLASQAARARDGDKAEKALEIFATAFTLRNSFHCNGDQSGRGYSQFTYDPFTLEGNFAAAAGVQEMLLQSHRGVIRLFPAVPDAWRDVSFTTLRAEGAFLVSAQRAGGRVTWVEVVAERGGVCRLAAPFGGEADAIREVTLQLQPGERRVLRAG